MSYSLPCGCKLVFLQSDSPKLARHNRAQVKIPMLLYCNWHAHGLRLINIALTTIDATRDTLYAADVMLRNATVEMTRLIDATWR